MKLARANSFTHPFSHQLSMPVSVLLTSRGLTDAVHWLATPKALVWLSPVLALGYHLLSRLKNSTPYQLIDATLAQ